MSSIRDVGGKFRSKCCNRKHEEWTGTPAISVKPEHYCPIEVRRFLCNFGAKSTQKFCKACITIAKAKLEDSSNISAEDVVPVAEELATVAEDTPIVPTNAPLMPENAPPVAEDVVPVADDVIAVAEDTPAVPANAPPVAEDVVPVADDIVPVADNVAAVTGDSPHEDTPLVPENAPDVVEDVTPLTSVYDLQKRLPVPMAAPTHFSHNWNHSSAGQFTPSPFSVPSHQSRSPIQFQYPTTTTSGIQFPSAPVKWLVLSGVHSRTYIIINNDATQEHEIVKSVKIWSNGSWVVRIFRNTLNLQHMFPVTLPHSRMALDLLEYVDRLRLCIGNSNPDTITMVKNRPKPLPNAYIEERIILEDELGEFRTETIRHSSCTIVITDKGFRCKPCSDHKSYLGKLVTRAQQNQVDVESRTRSDSKVPLGTLPYAELLIRARQLSKSVKTLRQKSNRLLASRLQHEVKNGICMEETDVSNGLVEMVNKELKDSSSPVHKHFPPDSFGRLFWEQQEKALQIADPRGHRWHPMVIKWALNLRLSSSKAYNVIRDSGVLKLPNNTTLKSFIHWKEHTSGFSVESLQQLLHSFKFHERHENQKHVIIVHDEMKVKADLVYSKSTGQLVGFKDLGDFNNTLNDFEAELQKETDPEKQLAHYVLVFQVRALFWNFNFPLAQFPTTTTKGCEIFDLFWRAVEILELAGLKVMGVTCDGAATNRKFLDLHGKSSSGQPIYKAPNPFAPKDQPREIFLFNDPPHLIKCVRNALASKKRMLWNNGNILWKLVEDLYYSDVEQGGLYLNKKLTYEHICLTSYSKMKVGLAAEVISTSVAKALSMFHGSASGPTVEFIETFDKFFDCLNVRSQSESVTKKKDSVVPYESGTDWRLKWLLEDFISYLDKWEEAVAKRGGTYTKTQRNKMLIPAETTVALRRTAKAFVYMTTYLLKQPGVNFVLSEKMNQDKLESLFGNVRQMKGGHEAPSISQLNVTMDTLRMKTNQDLRVLRGNSYDKRAVETLQVDDTPLIRKRQKRSMAPSTITTLQTTVTTLPTSVTTLVPTTVTTLPTTVITSSSTDTTPK